MHKGTNAAKLLEAMLLKLSASKIGLPSVVTTSSKAKTASTQKPAPGAEAEVAEDPMSKISLLVGHILSCGAHPDADSLLVEQIDVGEEAPRTICSGLAKHYTNPTDLVGKRVIIVANLEAKNLRGIRSHGMVLCASSQDKAKVELLEAPEGSLPGTRIQFPISPGEALPVLKKKLIKHWEAVIPELRTDMQGVATYKGCPFETNFGKVKSATLCDAQIS